MLSLAFDPFTVGGLARAAAAAASTPAIKIVETMSFCTVVSPKIGKEAASFFISTSLGGAEAAIDLPRGSFPFPGDRRITSTVVSNFLAHHATSDEPKIETC